SSGSCPPASADIRARVPDSPAAHVEDDPDGTGGAVAFPLSPVVVPAEDGDVVPAVAAHAGPGGEAQPDGALAQRLDALGQRLRPGHGGTQGQDEEGGDVPGHGRLRAHGCSMMSWSALTARGSSLCPSQKSAFFLSSVSGSRRAISSS